MVLEHEMGVFNMVLEGLACPQTIQAIHHHVIHTKTEHHDFAGFDLTVDHPPIEEGGREDWGRERLRLEGSIATP